MTKQWAQVSYRVPEALVDEISEFLFELSPDGIITENLTLDTFSLESLELPPTETVTAFFEADGLLPEKLATVRAFLEQKALSFPGFIVSEPDITYIREEDWSSSWKSHFKPSRIGKRLLVKPTWEEYQAAPQDIILELDPGMAFGTGTHATTRLCMEVLEKLFFHEGAFRDYPKCAARDILDVGTGSGILSITAEKLGAETVVAIDIDPQAVTVAQENIILNDSGRQVTVSDTPLDRITGTYDIVVANILAEELAKMADQLTSRVNRGGFLILSGILTEKEDIVTRGFSSPNLRLAETSRQEEWSCLTYYREK